jgi:hypothetical protein
MESQPRKTALALAALLSFVARASWALMLAGSCGLAGLLRLNSRSRA